MIARARLSPASLSAARKGSVAAVLAQATARLRPVTDTPRLETDLLLAHVLGLARADLYAYPERLLQPGQLGHFQALLDRRAEGEPLPYLTGHAPFYGLDFTVTPDVLIPRPETETLVELALRWLADRRPPDQRLALADVGTGSGCVVVALTVNSPQILAYPIYALDLSPEALAVARLNAERHGVDERIRFLQSDLLAALPGPVDLIVANPPYVSAGEWPALPGPIRAHEPRLALHGGPDGLVVVRRLLRQAPAYLRPDGALLIEIGAAQGPAVAQLARRAFAGGEVSLHADLAGRDRVLRVQAGSAGCAGGQNGR